MNISMLRPVEKADTESPSQGFSPQNEKAASQITQSPHSFAVERIQRMVRKFLQNLRLPKCLFFKWCLFICFHSTLILPKTHSYIHFHDIWREDSKDLSPLNICRLTVPAAAAPPHLEGFPPLARLGPQDSHGRNPANQLRLVVYPIISRFFLHPRWCRMSSINSTSQHKVMHFLGG